MKRPLRIVVCKASLSNLINVSAPFSVILQLRNFYKLEFTNTSSVGKAAKQITKAIQATGLKLEVESFKFVKHSWCQEFSKV